jgi:hypothetical protein
MRGTLSHSLTNYKMCYIYDVLLAQIWMDVDNMSGSTLEAMAQAVEESAAVLICVNKKYKDSQVWWEG